MKKPTEFPALFIDETSNYILHPRLDPFTIHRNALTCTSKLPGISHPPCGPWSRLHALTRKNTDHRLLGIWAALRTQLYGGILEQPAFSKLWTAMDLPRPGEITCSNEFSISVDLHWFGYPARKPTWLFFSGLYPDQLPRLPISFDAPTKTVGHGKPPYRAVPKKDRAKTPEMMIEYFVECLDVIYQNQTCSCKSAS